MAKPLLPSTVERRRIRAEKAAAALAARSAKMSARAATRYDTPGRKQAYLKALGEGHTKTAARVLAGREDEKGRMVPLTDQTVRKWRERDPVFRSKADELYGSFRKTDPDAVTPSYDGSFVSFRKNFFGMDTFPHQRKIINAIDAADKRKMGDATLVLCPPEHGKTAVVTDYICYRIALDPNIRITVVSAGQGHARKIIGQVRARMTKQGSPFVMQFGPFYEPGQEKRGKPWATDHITVVQADHDERDYTLEARGWTSEVQGTRCDLMILDDLQNVRSLSQTEKMMEVIRQDFVTRLGASAPMVFVGTRVGMDDIYDVMIEEDFVDHLVQMPAINSEGEALWPEMWSVEKLGIRRRKLAKEGNSEDTWYRTYMQEPQAKGTGAFSEYLLSTIKDKMADHQRPTDCVGVIIGVDPALDGGNAIIACAYTPEWLRVIDMYYDFGLSTSEAIFARVDDMAVRYGASRVIIEHNAMQKGIVRDQRLDELASHHNYQVVAHQTGILKLDPVFGIPGMADSMRRGELQFAWGGTYLPEQLAPLCRQLISWRQGIKSKNLRQDTVMSLWFAHKWWKENRMIGAEYTSQWNTGVKTPWTPVTRLVGVA